MPSSHLHGRVLVVDDLEANIALVKRVLVAEGFEVCSTHRPDDAMNAVRREQPDVILMDVRMPGSTGFDLCRALKQDAATRLIPLVLMTALSNREDRLQAIEAGADDFVAKPLNVEELKARLRSLVRLKRFTDDLESAEQVIVSLALTIEARDGYTEGHCHRLAQYGTAVGEMLGLAPDDLQALHRGAYLHDVGKIGIPDSILLKPDRLTPDEVAQMKKHPLIGARLCGELRSLVRVRPIVRWHHERLDGSGYPDGLKGDAIPLLAQITGVVDVYDALTTQRPYREALSHAEARAILHDEVARGWRRGDLVDVLMTLVESGRLETSDEVGATNGRPGVKRHDD
jgi:putative two-component system response regulator